MYWAVAWGRIELVTGEIDKRKGVEALIRHLEGHPKPMLAKISSEKKDRYENAMQMIKFKIEGITGKEGAGSRQQAAGWISL